MPTLTFLNSGLVIILPVPLVSLGSTEQRHYNLVCNLIKFNIYHLCFNQKIRAASYISQKGHQKFHYPLFNPLITPYEKFYFDAKHLEKV